MLIQGSLDSFRGIFITNPFKLNFVSKCYFNKRPPQCSTDNSQHMTKINQNTQDDYLLLLYDCHLIIILLRQDIDHDPEQTLKWSQHVTTEKSVQLVTREFKKKSKTLPFLKYNVRSTTVALFCRNIRLVRKNNKKKVGILGMKKRRK